MTMFCRLLNANGRVNDRASVLVFEILPLWTEMDGKMVDCRRLKESTGEDAGGSSLSGPSDDKRCVFWTLALGTSFVMNEWLFSKGRQT